MAIDYTSNLGKVRVLICDTDETSFMFSDPEIEAILSLNFENVYATAADLCRAIASCAAKCAIAYKIMSSEFEVDRKKVPDYYIQLANDHEAKIDLAADVSDIFVEWGLLVNRVDGRDDTTYSDENPYYYQDHNWEDGL